MMGDTPLMIVLKSELPYRIEKHPLAEDSTARGYRRLVWEKAVQICKRGC
jgi:hypothetical protein